MMMMMKKKMRRIEASFLQACFYIIVRFVLIIQEVL